MKLNLGCGSRVLPGWVNADYALGARLAKWPLFGAVNRRLGLFDLDWHPDIVIHDLTRPFPWAAGSAEVVYSSHTLEHFTRDDGRRFLTECYRVLRPGGVLRIVVPDLRHEVQRYLDGELRAEDFVENLYVIFRRSANPLKTALGPWLQFPHKCMYDTPRLVAILRELGFDAGARAAFDSAIADIRAIELPDRTTHAVIVEGRK
jgi:SAM-dependent methyltransferase